MSKIDYEAEVKKIYPDAECHENGDRIWDITSMEFERKNKMKLLLGSDYSKELAWQSAYKNLTKQNK